MNKKIVILLPIILIALIGGLAYVLVARDFFTHTDDTNQVVVVATIFPLADIIKNVGGEHVRVVTLVPPGRNEHSYALSTAQVAQAANAKVIFAIGQKLDNHIFEPLQRAQGIPVKTVEVGIALRDYHLAEEINSAESEAEEHHHDAGVDPHYWLTVPNGQKIATTIMQELIEHDPSNRGDYEKNVTAYNQQLAQLEVELQKTSAAAPHPNFIAMHNAWSYLAPAYHFNLVATYEPVEGSQPSLADLQRLGQLITQYQIATFYAEPQKVSSAATKVMSNQFNLAINTLDPTGGTLGRDSYIAMMRANIAALSQ